MTETWKGRPIEDLSRDELREALRTVIRERHEQADFDRRANAFEREFAAKLARAQVERDCWGFWLARLPQVTPEFEAKLAALREKMRS